MPHPYGTMDVADFNTHLNNKKYIQSSLMDSTIRDYRP